MDLQRTEVVTPPCPSDHNLKLKPTEGDMIQALNSGPLDESITIGASIRRIAIIILISAVNWLAFIDWRASPRLSPIRGAKGIRPVGEVCFNDFNTGKFDKVNRRHAIVFDAGSTGSRIHVYEFQYCGEKLEVLIDEVFEEVKPGLSHYHEDPHKAAVSLKPLLQSALVRIPDTRRDCTPLVVKATAGLRLLPEQSVHGILNRVREFVASHKFLLGDGISTINEAVSVMDGSEEAVFAWVTVNFLEERLKPGLLPLSIEPEETSVVMDLGGGSTQIVYAINSRSNQSFGFDLKDHPNYYYKLKLHGLEIDLYQQSYLGYGLMEARKQIKSGHIKKFISSNSTRLDPLKFPCFPRGFKQEVDGTVLVGDLTNWDSCLNVVKPIFNKEVACQLEPCSFNGIHQPAIKAKSLIAFSYFFDRLIPLGLSSPVTLYDIDREGRRLCNNNPSTARYKKSLEEEPQWCLDLAYIFSLLRVGYQISFDQPIVVTKQINGYEAGWSLGAALKLLENAPKCKDDY